MDQAAEGITKFTFGKMQRQFKVANYALSKAAWLADHPNALPIERSDAMHSITKELNAIYGGLHPENLGVNRTSVELLRAIMLAPDWTFSNIFNVKYAFERGTPAGKMARMFWMRTAVGGLALTQALSLLISRQLSTNPTQVYMGKDKDGNDIYQNIFFKGAPGDLVNLIHNVMDYGAVGGLVVTMKNKLQPVLRTATDLAANQNWMRQEIYPRGGPFLSNTWKAILFGIQGVSPIPFSVSNVKDMLIGPKAEDFTTPEFLTTLFAGTPPRHVRPPGTPEEEEKRRKKHERGTFIPTVEGAQLSAKRREWINRVKRGDPGVEAELEREVDEGRMTNAQRASILRQAARP
jgi:hypothetical protein